MNIDGEAIKRKAYELWEKRGRPLGSPEVDWIEAEMLLRGTAGVDAGTTSVVNGIADTGLRYGLREIDEDRMLAGGVLPRSA
jgi:hypothetical protein